MGEEKTTAAVAEVDDKGEMPIQNMYSFWYIKRNTGNKAESYEKSIKELGEFKTVQGFWRVYNHLVRPNDLPNTMDYHLFKTGIKPMWEDAANRRGGKWMVRIRKGIASRYWEDLVLAIIGEQFDVGNEICGAVMSIRYNEDIISLWNRNADNNEACFRIRDTMRRVLNLPQFVVLEYKRHDTSLSDNSSFRNTTAWRSDKAAPGTEGQSSGTGRSSNSSGHRNSGTQKESSLASGGNNSGRFSRERFDKSSSSSSSRPAWGRDGSAKRGTMLNKSVSVDGSESSLSSLRRINARTIPAFKMDQPSSLKSRNKGVAMCALIRDEQERFKDHDSHLQVALEDYYEYVTKHVDPVLGPAIEQALLYQPDQAADFLAQYLRGTLNPKKYNYVEIKRQQYFDRKVRHLLALAMNSAIKDRPEDVVVYLAEFFEARTRFY